MTAKPFPVALKRPARVPKSPAGKTPFSPYPVRPATLRMTNRTPRINQRAKAVGNGKKACLRLIRYLRLPVVPLLAGGRVLKVHVLEGECAKPNPVAIKVLSEFNACQATLCSQEPRVRPARADADNERLHANSTPPCVSNDGNESMRRQPGGLRSNCSNNQ